MGPSEAEGKTPQNGRRNAYRNHPPHPGVANAMSVKRPTTTRKNRNIMIPVPRSSSVSYTHLRAHETVLDLVCRLLLETKKNNKKKKTKRKKKKI